MTPDVWWGDAGRLPELHEVLDEVFPQYSSGSVWNGPLHRSLIPAEPDDEDDEPVRAAATGAIVRPRASGVCNGHGIYTGPRCPLCPPSSAIAAALYSRFGLSPRRRW